jgi:hypothetical protein
VSFSIFLTKDSKSDKVNLQKFNFYNKENYVAKKKTVLSQAEFERKIQEGEFSDKGCIHIHDITVSLDLSSIRSKQCEIFGEDKEISSLEIERCKFQNGLSICGTLSSVTITDCSASSIAIYSIINAATEEETEDGILLRRCKLDSLHIDGMLFSTLHIHNTRVQRTEIRLSDERDRVFNFSNFDTDTLNLSAAGEITSPVYDVRKNLKLSFESYVADENMFETAEPLTVRRRIQTNIPQFAAFCRLACPNVPTYFVLNDMRDLLVVR